MKQIRLSFSFLLLLLVFSHSTATDVGNGLKPFRSTINSTKSRIAFLIGINSYKATTSLKYAVGDSEAIEDLLLRTGKYDKLIKLNDFGKITTTLNSETLSYSSQRIKMAPTKANIEATYQEILAANPDTLLFYYSGHGFIEGEGGENFIAPKDVDVKFEKKKVGKEEKQVPVPLNGISLKTMGIQAAKVKRVVFLIDACRSPLPEADDEVSKKGEKALSSTSEKNESNDEKTVTSKEIQLKQNLLSTKTDKLPKRVLEAEGITMLIGAAPEVSSLEDEDFKSGIFTHFLKKAFNGGVQEENQEEYITEENLSRYIEDRFKDYYEKRKKETELAAEPKLYNLTFDRGKKGELLLTHHRPIEGKERIDKLIYTDKIRNREVKGKLVYNEKGEREDLRFFVHDKKRDVYYPDSLDGVYKMEYSFNKDKSGEIEKFTASEFNLENEEVFEYGTKLIPNVGWEYRGIYNNTVETDIIGVETGLRPVSTSTEKIRFERKIFDFNGNIISEEYFDAKGKPLEFGGVAKIVRAYDKYGQVILEEFYGKDTLDEYGDVTEKGKLVAKDGFARYKAKYKSKGNLLLETWEDKDGKIVNTKLGKNRFKGFAKVKYIYDKSDRLIRKKVYNKENKPEDDKWGVSVYSYSYNSDCIKFHESKIPKDIDQVLFKDRKLEIYKLCLAEEFHTDKEGKPANDENQIYKKIRKFNQKGFLVSEESFISDGRRYLENAVARHEYAHDDEGNIISQKNFGEFEVNGKLVPISDANGVHEYRYSYFDLYEDGTPLFNPCMNQRKVKGIMLKPFDCALKIERFGLTGKPLEDKNGVFYTSIYYTGVDQEEFDRMNYSKENIFLFRKRTDFLNKMTFVHNGVQSEGFSLKAFDVKGKEQALEVNYKVINGREYLDEKKEIRFDERNNKILETTHKVEDGVGAEAVLNEKKEYKYDERNNITLSVEFSYRFETSWYTRKKNKYDSRNNKTQEIGFSVKDGKYQMSEWKTEYKYDEKNRMISEEKYTIMEGKDVLTNKIKYEYDESNNKILELTYDFIDGKDVLVSKNEWNYDKSKNKLLQAYYTIRDGKDVLVRKEVWKYKDGNISSTDSYKPLLEYRSYRSQDGKEVCSFRNEYKYDEKNNEIFKATFEVKEEEEKEVLTEKIETFFDKENNEILKLESEIQEDETLLNRKKKKKYDKNQNIISEEHFEMKDGKEILVRREERKYDEKNNEILHASFKVKEGNEILLEKIERKFDDRNNEFYTAMYSHEFAKYFPQYAFETKEKRSVIDTKLEKKYDEKNRNIYYTVFFKTQDGKEVLGEKSEFKYDDRNNIIQTLKSYKTRTGKEIREEKSEYKFDAKNNKILDATYRIEDGTEILLQKQESQFDEKNKKTFSSSFFADAKGPLAIFSNSGFRLEYYYGSVNRKFPNSQELEDQLEKIKNSKDPKDESEKKTLTEKLEPSKKYFEDNEKKFTLTDEKFGKNEKLESATYKLLFFNPRGPAEKRLMRVDLDQFYRPVKVGFEEE
jgi:uncharacterized caspase-like protein